jgi:membrane-associated protease RseP (regulator of RpoE activity)
MSWRFNSSSARISQTFYNVEVSCKLGDILVSVLFYALLFFWIALQFVNKSWFEKRGVERGPLTLIFRWRRGLEVIDRIAKKRERLLKKLGTLAVYISAPLILLVVVSLFISASHILKTPDAPPGIAPILPEGIVDIPGAPSIPLAYWFLSIVVILVFHEIFHGFLARAENIPLKSLGIFALTFIPLGAFVEPDDLELEKKPAMSKLRVYAAGSMGNFIAAFLFGIVLASLLLGIAPLAFEGKGVTIFNVTDNSPAARAGLQPDLKLIGIGEIEINSLSDFRAAVSELQVGVPILVRTDQGSFQVTPEMREGFEQGYIGIAAIPEVAAKPYIAETFGERRAFRVYGTAVEGLGWIVLLNFLVGLTNLLPIVPLDGGRMFPLMMEKISPKGAKKITTLFTLFLIVLLIINIGPLFGFF